MSPAPPPIPPLRPQHGLLNYRAVRYLAFVGIAPKWIDGLLIIATGVCVFVAIGAVVPLFLAEVLIARVIAIVVMVFGWAGVIGLWWWSNHFRHKRPMSVDDPASPSAPQTAPLRVIPVEEQQALPVIPLSAADPIPPRSGADPLPAEPADPAR